MPDPYLILAGASALVSFGANRSAAKLAQREAAMQQRQLQAEKEASKLRALQEHNARLAKLEAFLNANQAIAGISGRDIGSDRSLKAIQEKAKKDVSIDAGRARLQELLVIGKLASAQQISAERGRNRAKALRYQAFGSLLSNALKAKPLIGSAPDMSSASSTNSLGPLRFSTYNTGLDNT